MFLTRCLHYQFQQFVRETDSFVSIMLKTTPITMHYDDYDNHDDYDDDDHDDDDHDDNDKNSKTELFA